MNPRPLTTSLGFGLFLALANVAGGEEIADDTKVQRLAQPYALRQLANQGSTAGRKYLTAVANRYRAAGYPQLAGKLRQADALLDLFASRGQPAGGRRIQTARAELRAIKANLRGLPKVTLPGGNETRVPHYWNLALTFTDLGSQALANSGRRGPAPLAAFTVPNRTVWVERLKVGSSSGGSSGSYGGTLVLGGGFSGWNGTTTVGGNLSLNPYGNATISGNVTLQTGDWLLFDPFLQVPDELSGQKTITWKVDYTVNGNFVGAGGKLVSVTEGTVPPDGATEPTLPITLTPAPSPSPTPVE